MLNLKTRQLTEQSRIFSFTSVVGTRVSETFAGDTTNSALDNDANQELFFIIWLVAGSTLVVEVVLNGLHPNQLLTKWFWNM